MSVFMGAIHCCALTPTVCPSIVSRNLLLYPSLPVSIPYGYALLRRRNDDTGVGPATRGSVEGLHRVPRRVSLDGGSSTRLRGALSTRSWDRGQPAQRAPLSGRPPVPPGPQECGEERRLHRWRAPGYPSVH